MTFLPGSGVRMTNAALVTEKDGRLWLVDVASGKQAGGRRACPRVKVAGQGGLGDVVASPDFAGNQRVYLSFVEAGPERHQRRGAWLWPLDTAARGAPRLAKASG